MTVETASEIWPQLGGQRLNLEALHNTIYIILTVSYLKANSKIININKLCGFF